MLIWQKLLVMTRVAVLAGCLAVCQLVDMTVASEFVFAGSTSFSSSTNACVPFPALLQRVNE